MKQTKTIIKLMELHLNEIQSKELKNSFANCLDFFKRSNNSRELIKYFLKNVYKSDGDMYENALWNEKVQSLPDYETEINWINENLLK